MTEAERALLLATANVVDLALSSNFMTANDQAENRRRLAIDIFRKRCAVNDEVEAAKKANEALTNRGFVGSIAANERWLGLREQFEGGLNTFNGRRAVNAAIASSHGLHSQQSDTKQRPTLSPAMRDQAIRDEIGIATGAHLDGIALRYGLTRKRYPVTGSSDNFETDSPLRVRLLAVLDARAVVDLPTNRPWQRGQYSWAPPLGYVDSNGKPPSDPPQSTRGHPVLWDNVKNEWKVW